MSQDQFVGLIIIGIIVFIIITLIIYRALLINKSIVKRIRLQIEEVLSSKNLIQEQSNKLKKLDKAKSRFFADISYDLKSPLTIIMGNIEKVLNDKEVFLSNKVEKLLKSSYSNGGKLIYLTNKINDLIQLEDGKLTLKPKEINPVAFLSLVTGMFRSIAELKAIDLAFINELENNIKTINIDIEQFEKVMFNLLSNAFKYTRPNDSIKIILRQKDSTYYTIIIKDSGEGIHEKNVPYVFDLYYKAQDNTNKIQEELGIGLALVKEIVLKHQGRVWVTSEFSKGSEFGIDLKMGVNSISISDEQNIGELTLIKEKQNEIAGLEYLDTKEPYLVNIDLDQNEERSGQVILIVDDHLEIREYIKSIIEDEFQILEAKDGKKALEILSNKEVDLIITDLMMPFIDGFELLEKLKEDEKLKTIPALVVSARITEEDKNKVLSSGVNDFLSKPFNAQELLQRIKNLLHSKEIWNNSNEDAIFINSKTKLDDAQKAMIKKIELLVLDKLDDPNLSVLDLANEMAASERQVYRMIKKLTDLTPFEYIKEVRWQYVQYLFKNNKVSNSSEAARNIGMNNVSHFKTQYKKRFGSEPDFNKN
jgi:signal transduction histidine kinase/DNA-binding response OmpR family regulator